jgi:hypothetical protein
MKIAKLIKKVGHRDNEIWQGIYQLSEPLSDYNYVLVSAVNRPKTNLKETFIFGVGAVEMRDDGCLYSVDWTAMAGSIDGVFDHAMALKSAGYEMLTDEMIN